MLARDISAEVWPSDGDWDRIDFLERVLEERLTRDGWELQFAAEFQRSPRPLTPEQRKAVDRIRVRIGAELEAAAKEKPGIGWSQSPAV